MKNYITRTTLALVLSVLFLTLNAQLSTSHAQGTAFTYQGELQNNGAPASGTYNLQFSLYTTSVGGAAVAGPVITNGVIVSNGLFVVTIDLGGSAWNGRINWLEIDVETNGASPFTLLAPRQQITPTPYAIFSGNASNLVGTLSAGQLSGTVGNGQLANNSVTVTAGTGLSGGGTVALGGSTTLNNAGVTSLAGSQGVTVSASSGSVTLGSSATTFNQPSTIVSRNALGAFSAGSITASNLFLPSAGVVYTGGNPMLRSDSVSNTFVGVSSGGSSTGPENMAIGYEALFSNTLGSSNVANGDFALYSNASGSDNVADGFGALYSNNTSYNTAEGYQALYADVDGQFNVGVGYEVLFSSIHGHHNTAVGWFALGDATNSIGNTAIGVEAMPYVTTGSGNTGVGVNACINDMDGMANTGIGYQALFFNISGSNNIALGYLAGININGGSSNIDIGNEGNASDANIIRIGASQTATYLVGNVYTASGTVEMGSDRNTKENFAAIDPQTVLAKVTSMPVTEWNYKSDKTVQHIGPMAQDFQAAFGLNGQDDKHISVVDEGGVALAAIQGLSQKVDELKTELDRRDAENAQLQRQNDLLVERLNQLEAAVNRLSTNPK